MKIYINERTKQKMNKINERIKSKTKQTPRIFLILFSFPFHHLPAFQHFRIYFSDDL